MNTSVEKMIEQYLIAWNETTLQGYQTEFAKCWSADAVYTDPYTENITGVDGIVDFAHKSLAIIPTRKFEILDAPEYHHGYGKYVWKVILPDGYNIGYDFFEYNEDFKITRIVSFFKLSDDYPQDKVYTTSK